MRQTLRQAAAAAFRPPSLASGRRDVPDCGNTEFFINLKLNAHLDDAYGGYSVFAEVADDASFAVVDKIAVAVKGGRKTKINKVSVV